MHYPNVPLIIPHRTDSNSRFPYAT